MLSSEGSLLDPVDLIPQNPQGLTGTTTSVIPTGRARRTEYHLAEIAHFALCPYRYKLERIDDQAQCYSTAWQISFAAEGFWLERIAGYLERTSDRLRRGSELHRWLREAYRETRGEVEEAFPGLRPLDWVGITQYVGDTMRNFYEHEKMLAKGERYGVRVHRLQKPLTIELVESDRDIRILCELRYYFQKGQYNYPFLLDTFVEQWLRFGSKVPEGEEELSFSEEDRILQQEDLPEEEPLLQGSCGIERFFYQYDASLWWRRAVKAAFFYHHSPNSTPAFAQSARESYASLCAELPQRIRQVEQGIYPKNPGDHCKYCPLQEACLGLEP